MPPEVETASRFEGPEQETAPKPVDKIIGRFGGEVALATLIQRSVSTIRHWRRTGAVPVKWRGLLLAMAKEKGLALEPSDFQPSPNHAATALLVPGPPAATASTAAEVLEPAGGQASPKPAAAGGGLWRHFGGTLFAPVRG